MTKPVSVKESKFLLFYREAKDPNWGGGGNGHANNYRAFSKKMVRRYRRAGLKRLLKEEINGGA